MRRVATTASLAAFAAATAMGYNYKDFYRVDEWEYPRIAGTLYYVDSQLKVSSMDYDLIPDADGSYRSDLSDAGVQSAYSAF